MENKIKISEMIALHLKNIGVQKVLEYQEVVVV